MLKTAHMKIESCLIMLKGYYVGTAVWPSISLKLLDEFGYSKAMGIMSTLHVIHMLAGITFYQPGEVTGPIQSSLFMHISDVHLYERGL